MKNKFIILIALLVSIHSSLAQGTAFTYQGRLHASGNPANGRYDFIFDVFAAASGGSAVAGSVATNNVPVTNGLFTVRVDFGSTPFTGAARWLQISVSTNGAGNYSTLAPRQQLTPTPYAIYSGTAGSVTNGAISNAQIATGQVVKSLNGLKDNVTLAAGANVSFVTNGNTLSVSSSGTGGAFSLNGTNAYYNAGNVGIGTASPVDPFEVVTGIRRVGLNTAVAGVNAGGVASFSNPSSGNKPLLIGVTASPNEDCVVFGSGGGTEMRLVSGGFSSAGFGFYLNTLPATAFSSTRPIPAVKIDGNGKVGIGTSAPGYKLDVDGAVSARRDTTKDLALRLQDDRTDTPFSDFLCKQSFYDYDNSAEAAYIGLRHNLYHGPLFRALVFGVSDTTGVPATEKMRITRDGNVGIGTTSPSGRLQVVRHQEGMPSLVVVNAFGPSAEFSGDVEVRGDVNCASLISSGAIVNGDIYSSFLRINRNPNYGVAAIIDIPATSGVFIDFEGNSATKGNITLSGETVSYNAFTGSHYGWTDETISRGALVRLSGDNQYSSQSSASEPVYGVVRTSMPNDSRCLGAYLSLKDPSKPYSRTNTHLIMAVGNGDMWVTDGGNGDIQPGDYLISSDVAGCAMKDDSDKFPVGYICARAGERVRWSDVQEREGIKRIKISVLFESFVRDSRGAQLISLVKTQQAELQLLRAEVKSLRGLQERLARLEAVADKNADLTVLRERGGSISRPYPSKGDVTQRNGL